MRGERADEPALRTLLHDLGVDGIAGRDPRDLSSGQRQRAAVAAILCGSPSVALLDEPTRGMDGTARAGLVAAVRSVAARGTSVVVATHDSELAAIVADRVLIIDEGRVHDRGAPSTALSGTHEHATQLGRLFASPGPVTVDAVAAHLQRSGATAGGVAMRLAAVSAAGLALFLWPFTNLGAPGTAAAAAVSIGCVVALLAVETMSRRLDTRGLAVIAAIAAVDSALRLALVSGIGGFSPIFLLILCAGYAMGAEFGFLCGATTLLVSALVTAGVGPWLPYEMIAAGWVGAAAGLAGARPARAHAGAARRRRPRRRRGGQRFRVWRGDGRLGLDVLSRRRRLRLRAGAAAGHGRGTLRPLLRGDVAGVRRLPRRRQRGAGGHSSRAPVLSALVRLRRRHVVVIEDAVPAARLSSHVAGGHRAQPEERGGDDAGEQVRHLRLGAARGAPAARRREWV